MRKSRKNLFRNVGKLLQDVTASKSTKLSSLPFFPVIAVQWLSFFLRNRQVTRSNTDPKPDILTVVVMVFLDLSWEM